LDKSFPESVPQPVGDTLLKSRVPRFILVVIIAIFAAMYWYAAYGDTPAPEKTVKTFYQAYFDRDFNTVAKNLSVFWSVRFLPDYASMSPQQLLENRTKIEGDISKVIADIEKDNQIPAGVSIEVMKEYTKMGQNSAIVVYGFKENGKVTSMETALLIKEKGQLRIFNMSPVDPQTLEQIKAVDINVIDGNFDSLLKPEVPQ
jgi:hypothetical protein